MTITAVANPGFAPPRVEVTIDVPPGNVMTSVEVWRVVGSERTMLRSQPSPGFDARTVFDYECPYGIPVTYQWDGAYVDPTSLVVEFSDNYSTYPTDWAGDTSAASVTGAELTLVAPGGAAGIARLTPTTEWVEIELARLACSVGTLNVVYSLLFASGGQLNLNMFDGQLRYSGRRTAASVEFFGSRSGFNTTDPIRIVRLGSAFIIEQGPETVTLPYVLGNYIGSELSVPAIASQVTVGQLTVSSGASAPVAMSETSGAVVLDSDDMWLVAPQSPGLSFAVGEEDGARAGVSAHDSTSYASRTTVHSILGARLPVTTTAGLRGGEETLLRIRTVSDAERIALLALLETDFPFLINVPAQWDDGLPSGFYQAGEVTVARVANISSIPDREFTLPLIQVRAPIADVQNVGWSWAELAATFPSWIAVRSTFASWADLAANVRS